jgi:hypothetical protein
MTDYDYSFIFLGFTPLPINPSHTVPFTNEDNMQPHSGNPAISQSCMRSRIKVNQATAGFISSEQRMKLAITGEVMFLHAEKSSLLYQALFGLRSHL